MVDWCCKLERCGVKWMAMEKGYKMLLGDFKRAIDSKGRIILPREMRREFGTGIIVTKGLDNCLLLYPIDEWKKLVARIEEMPAGSEATRMFSRLFFSSASHLMPDGQGRILIPPALRDMAGLSKEVVIVGVSNKAEVWNPKRWDDYKRESSERYDRSASEIGF
jgi:MraZ protein